ncbi:M14 family metallopeptidase [Anaerotalea alkaliphila]|uniref:Succinylglutamate desuccinylase n=1 Tax=Anaerotalea alkaliphila TaxID=2662126 RepID=A0A7X5KMR7_9FIRM|nr:M14 family metallopeptidase [Anaerotalea alkaliphila]NDL68251.1 succinylglutamate desuccinylase [Anaerotalea alkaliphila]
MIKETVFELASPYRNDLRVTGYSFGKGAKAACIVGAMRGNEVQQLYVCSQLVQTLGDLEKRGAITGNNRILVIPSINHQAMNVGKRFWASDDSDINRLFPGDSQGETTQRIAAGILDQVQGYSYGIQLASFYMPGDFIPHVRLMDTGHQNASLGTLFGLGYVLLRTPRPYDTTTLNYNWQLQNTHAFSIYTNETDRIDPHSAKEAVASILRFLTRMGILKYHSHGGYISHILKETDLHTVTSGTSGIFRRMVGPGDEARYGDVLAEVIHPYEGHVIHRIFSPTDGLVFFAHRNPLVMENEGVFKLIKRLHS